MKSDVEKRGSNFRCTIFGINLFWLSDLGGAFRRRLSLIRWAAYAMWRHAILAFVAFVLTGCAGTSLPPIAPSDEVRVHVQSEQVARIDDPAVVSQLLALANGHLDGWSLPWYGRPVARTRLDFYSRGEFHANFGLGNAFFTRTHGEFFLQSANAKELSKLYALLGVRNPYE